LWPADFAPAALVSGARDVVYVGEMRDLKGVDVLIEAIALIGEEQVSAVLVGDGPDRAKVEALARQRGVAERVMFPGAMPASEAFTLGELMVVPSRNESFPYVVIEAIAAQKPLVATRVGGIPEILGDDALVAPGDPGALASSIRDFLADRAKWRRRAEARFDLAQNDLSAERMGDRVLSFYREISQ
jgi:glycosyltransferase involved in cell wall biosynthesis